ncbi:MAG: hypothetical protein J6Y28_09200 [Acholeplasmatales bacterium]|nr:hypothetical protein [Acholeplasmatales bacterium]
MKKIIYSISLVILALSILLIQTGCSKGDLDYIESFEIHVTTNNDATLNFDYHLKWKVLDSKTSGPLKDVRIGTPNKHVDNVEIISTDTITDIYKYYDDGDSGLKLILDRKYYKDEVVDLHFSFHQSRIYTLGKDETDNVELVTYEYIPCWFEDIEVGNVKIYWDKTNVYFNDANDEDETYLIWDFKDVKKGERVEANISYSSLNFPNLDENAQYNSKTKEDKIVLIIWIIIIVLVFIFTLISRIFRRASYYRTRGFFPVGRMAFTRSYYYGVNNKGVRKATPYVSTGSHSSHSSHSCACACACACAGGGRAGCSKKDFYKGNIKIEDLINKM